ncbi:MAG: RusA family crossover junction endodeoxyribonuclease, partial [Propionibacteriaceae bacterium]|nr:RusA family crossover junction endodeoxyribonuclease [Propionibacteriaceae bacterium]
IFRRPQSHYRTGARWKELKPQFGNAPMTRKPDLDKLCRSTLDAITDAGIWADDCQVTCLVTSKHWGDRTTQGARVTITPLTQDQS